MLGLACYASELLRAQKGVEVVVCQDHGWGGSSILYPLGHDEQIGDVQVSIVLLSLLADAGLKIKYFPQPCQIANRITDERCICSESAASHSVNPRCHEISLFAKEMQKKGGRYLFIFLRGSEK